MTIEDILSREEGQTFDRKSIRIKPKDLAVTIIAFANADGGDLVVGITDGKKEIEGVDDDQKVLNEIRRTPFDFCIPSVNDVQYKNMHNLQKVHYDQHYMYLLQQSNQYNPPVTDHPCTVYISLIRVELIED